MEDLADARGADRIKLRRAAHEFEAILIHQMLKATEGETARDMFGGGMAEEFFTDHMNMERARGLAESGGLGLADMLEQQILGPLNPEKVKNERDSAEKVNRQIELNRALKVYR